jgi:transcriptional/translational regulatory protein YebC/TACO1
VVDAQRYSEDDLFPAIDAGADDINLDADVYEVITSPESFIAVKRALEEAGVELESADLSMRPTTQVPLDEKQFGTLTRLIDTLEELDDVQAVHANFDVDADVLERTIA